MTGGEIAILVVVAAAVALMAVLIWLIVTKPAAQEPSLTLLQGEVQELQGLRDTLTGSFAEMKEGVGELRERSRQFSEIAADIASLDKLLQAPKFRGGIGELLLENVLSQALPPGTWDTQVDIGGKRADAVVKVGDKRVAIDAKFPVEDFRRLADAEEIDRTRCRKELIGNLKRKAEDVAKYIRPDLGTYNFALMYIPAEAVYYEVVADGDFFDYTARLRVFPVSPTTAYLYLCTIALGLKGLLVEEEAGQILNALARLETEWKSFEGIFKVLGTHVKNISSKYDEAVAEFSRISGRFVTISGGELHEPGDR
jgi:DNA recombination protein RmuC